jgi:ribosomal protein S18 acetylase RimI-like enzyme
MEMTPSAPHAQWNVCIRKSASYECIGIIQMRFHTTPDRYSIFMISIRPSSPLDADAVWRILEPTIRAGETYTLPRDFTREQSLQYWYAPHHEVFVAEEEGEILGTYYLRANQQGGGGHVANCGYMTDAAATGRGVASIMCTHSLHHARSRGFHAMQFNIVISTNEGAVRLWKKFGFEIVGRLPGAFHHPKQGYVDAFVMYRQL